MFSCSCVIECIRTDAKRRKFIQKNEKKHKKIRNLWKVGRKWTKIKNKLKRKMDLPNG